MIGRLRNLAWDGRHLLGGVFDAVRWPFERAYWAFERGAVWPLRERGTRLDTPARAVALGSLGVLAAGALAFGLAQGGGGDGGAGPVAALPVSEPLPVAKPKPAPEPEEPTLQGSAPDFTPASGEKAKSSVADAETVIGSKPSGKDEGAQQSAAAGPGADSAFAAKTSTAPKQVADPGPAAIDVARRFSSAFVRYETGSTDSAVRKAFEATASPQLTKALLRRPPRLPANAKVPKAKVLNVVPGPRQGSTFTLSASLLRVGITSELRIDVQREGRSGEWQVTDVLG